MDRDHEEFWTEVEQMRVEQNDDNYTNSSITASPTAQTIFSEDEFSFESTTTLPTPLKHPRYTSAETIDSVQSGSTQNASSARASIEKFVPVKDIPKRSTKDARFNRIRPVSVKNEEKEDIELAAWQGPVPLLCEADATRRPSPKLSTMYRQSVGEAIDDEVIDQQKLAAITTRKGSKIKPRTCADCRARHVRCTHTATASENLVLQPKSGNLRMPKVEDEKSDRKLRIKTEPGKNRVKKDGTSYIRVPHDRSKGLSMTPSAVDYRERKVIQQQYQDRLATLIDGDIVTQVEEEGGITPLGRILKGAVRMVERCQRERAGMVKAMREPATNHDTDDVMGEQYQQGKREVSPLDTFKAKLQALINEGQ